MKVLVFVVCAVSLFAGSSCTVCDIEALGLRCQLHSTAFHDASIAYGMAPTNGNTAVCSTLARFVSCMEQQGASCPDDVENFKQLMRSYPGVFGCSFTI